MTETDGPPRAVFIAALAVAVAALVGVIVVAANQEPAPVPIAAVPAPKAEDPACAALLAALPDSLGDYERAEAAPPAPPGTAAWRGTDETEPVILRCGLDRPVDFVVGAPLQMVDDVSWFRVGEGDRITWFVVDRSVYVALTLPQNSGATPIQEISRAVSATLPAQEIDPAPAR
ncbi:DUF3515 domain-containing protein [Mycolicibacterium confluentis]|uniref:Membrane protein n=1 Tax=Mycolicibacterium confluentis TaxID=28047 RepID=A0A7I7XZ11_9MYCO|nr:DUF3515 domain-containing protein [Mycolicibacterium confluentis]MCV7321528.1 DUF3515 domain-containing protein [Mycolicibacterium confluentis]ORV30087.1 hypothetical protein AWB99_13260 [Mycolicibacterium confluentis]BBZ34384.1 membrane protein [Mycolicibacterium confluentis]